MQEEREQWKAESVNQEETVCHIYIIQECLFPGP